MNSNIIYTRKAMGLDRRVWFTMLIMIILCLGLLSYKVINKEDCTPVSFSYRSLQHSKGNIFMVGEKITLNASSKAVRWSFGDDTREQTGQYVEHIYQVPGDYYITAGSGYSCEPTTMQVTIVKPAKPTDKVDPYALDAIEGTASAITGKSVYFTCKAPASFYEWSIVTIPQTTQVGPSAKFTFPSKGSYTIQVTLDNDLSRRYTKEVTVEDEKKTDGKENGAPLTKIDRLIPLDPLPLPETQVTKEPDSKQAETGDKPANNRPTFIADPTFFTYLQKVIKLELKAADFEKYGIFAGTPVMANGEMKNFGQLCNDLIGKKKKVIFWNKSAKLKTAALHRTNSDVTLVEVNYEYK